VKKFRRVGGPGLQRVDKPFGIIVGRVPSRGVFQFFHTFREAVKQLNVDSFRQEACAGAPAPPRCNARSARVFGCGFRTVMGQDRPDSTFSQLQGAARSARGLSGRSSQTRPRQPPEGFAFFPPFVKGEYFQERPFTMRPTNIHILSFAALCLTNRNLCECSRRKCSMSRKAEVPRAVAKIRLD
jgi:hypothetical protein